MNIAPDKALETVLRAALARELAGKAVGWAFQLSRSWAPLATVCEGYARAPWEDEFPALPMSPDLRLHMASMSKSITACAVMLAIDDWGRAQTAIGTYVTTSPGGAKPDDANTFVIAKNLRLHPAFVRKVRDQSDFGVLVPRTPVNVNFPAVELLKRPYGRLLPSIPTLGAGAEAVTVKQLLLHQSGINYEGITWYDEWSDAFDVELFMRDVFARKTDPIYNTYQGGNSVILRWIVEGLTETPFHEYVKLRILQPAGARHMSPSLFDDGPERRALHYWSAYTKLAAEENAPALRAGNSMPDRYYFYAAGAGGYWGSVAEINLWLQQLLDPAATVYTSAARNALLGQGLLSGGSSMTMPWGLTVLKNGSAFGCNSCLAAVQAERLSAVLIVNSYNVDAQGALVRALGAVSPEITVPLPNTRGRVRINNPLGVGDLRYTDDGTPPATSATSRPYTVEFTPAVATGRIRTVVMVGGQKYTGEATADFRDIGVARNAETVTTRAGVAFRVSDGLYLVKLPTTLPQRFVTGVASRTSTWPAAAPPRPYSIEYIGYINAPAEQEYKFSLTSDDGSKFWIGQPGSESLLIDNDGLHGDQTRAGWIMLKAGRHRFRVEFFQLGGGASLTLDWDYAAQPLANALETDDPAAATLPAVTALSPATIQRNGTRRVQVQGTNLREITKVTSVPALTGQSKIVIPGGGSGTAVPLDLVLENNVTIGAYTLTIEFGAISRSGTINITA